MQFNRNIILFGLMFPLCLFASTDYWQFQHNESEGLHQNQSLTVSVDVTQLRESLLLAPLASLKNTEPVHLEFPTPWGELVAFEIVETPVMPELLAKRFPGIRTFTGRGINNPNDRVSITLNNNTVKVLMIGSKGNIYIGKKRDGSGGYLVTFNEAELTADPIEIPLTECGNGDAIFIDPLTDTDRDNRDFSYCVGEDEPCFAIGDSLVTYRYAGILTAEANNYVADGTIEGGLAWVASMANQINLLWVRELSFRLELIENSDLIIYTDENPTPIEFTDYDMYIELPRIHTFLYGVIGYGGTNIDQQDLLWEYGAVFNTGYAGGLAYVPGATSANLPYYDIHNHEIGHNLGSGHNCTVEGGWRSSFGGTAMCNRSNSLPGNYGNQYSSHTIDIAIRYQTIMTSGNGYDYQRGWRRESTENNIPNVELINDMVIIPKDTPFVLEGYGEDSDAENQLTYSWEPNDASSIAFSPPEFPPDTGPLFCSVEGKIDGNTRHFPSMESLLMNQYSTGNIEKLPFASREMNMRLLVRDNDLYSGGFNYKNVHLTVDENAGPFRVTSQSNSENWEVGSTQQITWDVANTTDVQGVNSSLVHILLSLNGGNDFDIVLGQDIPNDGSHAIIVPEFPTLENCRIMVKSADNVFFDINNSFISIINSNVPEVGIDESLIELNLPLESDYTLEVEIQNVGEAGSFLVYNALTELTLEGDGYLTFDGIDDHVDLGANMLSGDGDFSISLWVKSESFSAVIMQQRNGGFNGEYQLRFNSSGQIDFWTYRNGSQWSVTSPETFNDGIWHHVAVVQDGDINGGRLYVDGIELDSNSGGIVFLDGAIHTHLGADMRDFVNYLNGAINDVFVFNHALARTEVGTLYDNGFGFNPAYNHADFNSSEFLVASYPMTAMSGETLFDTTPNGHDGVLVGPIWSGDLIPVPNWMAIASESSWLSLGESDMIQVGITTNGLENGNEYLGDIIVASNADTEPILIPISLNIIEDNIQGDINGDGLLNIQDIILIVNMVLSGDYSTLADMNGDGTVNILDVVQVVFIIMNPEP